MENENEYELSFTAEEVDERLRKAGEAVLSTEQTLTPEQQAQARANIGAHFSMISILEADPAEPKEGQMWILKTATEKLTIPVIELGDVSENSIAFMLSNASFDGSGAAVTTYKIYVDGVLNKTENIELGSTCTVDGLSSETEYQISVRGVHGAVLSEMSNTLTATTLETTEQEIVILAGNSVSASENAPGVAFAPYSSRAVAVSTSGKQSIPPEIDSVTYYLLEVPPKATSCTVVCPDMMWGYNGWNTGSDGKLTYDVDSGWKDSGTTYRFVAGAAEYVSIGFKKVSGADFVAEDVAGISITFA